LKIRAPSLDPQRDATPPSSQALTGSQDLRPSSPLAGWRSPALRSILAILCIAVPIAAYLWYVSRYSVNVIFWDEWDIVPLIDHLRTGTLTLQQLWTLHNVHRMLVPNLIFLLVAQLTAYDNRVLMYLSAGLVIISYIALVLTYRRRQDSLLGIAPVAYLMFSLAQWENALWGFQVAWYIILACLLVLVYCLEQSGRSRPPFAFAIALAVVASFSSLQGLLLWPAGFIYVLRNNFTPRQRVMWLSFGLLTALVYLRHSGISGSLLSHHGHHPLESAEFFLVAIGSVIPIGQSGGSVLFLEGLWGLLLCAFSIYVIIVWSTHARCEEALLAPITLMTFALIFDILLAVGRTGVWGGLEQAKTPRYTTYNLLLMAGNYLALFHLLRVKQARETPIAAVAGAFVFLMFVQVAVSSWVGLEMGKGALHNRVQGADLVVNYRIAPASLITGYNGYPDPEIFRARAAMLERHHLSVFATSDAAVYADAGVVPGGRIGRVLPAPKALAPSLQQDGSLRRAWKTLSAIYFQRSDLQMAFPQTSQDYIAKLLSWATTSGVTTDPESAFLIPYTTQLSSMREALAKSAR
jgi:hypothetical protein